MTGPPFVFDPNATYPDQNVQAWAQYYAQGGIDPTGSVYFISVPGITNAPTAATAVQPAEGQQQQQQAGSVSGAEPTTAVTQGVHPRRQNSLPNPYEPGSPSSASAENAGGQRQGSLPNPYGLNSPSSGENVGGLGHGPASAGPEGPHAGARAPWQAATTLSGQFAQMRVGGE
jgi:signal transducing adaptor molecule